jgi:transcriptional regulator GlxA family with amidase domain
VQDGRICSSAGVTAGVDLTLALIERDLGIKTALQVARELVVFLKRPGGQSQFSNVLSAQMADAGGPFEALLAWIPEHLDADFRIEALAEKAGMSPRTFARSFVARIGKTPAQAVELIRIQAAKDAIEQSGTPLGVIAARCGFGNEAAVCRSTGQRMAIEELVHDTANPVFRPREWHAGSPSVMRWTMPYPETPAQAGVCGIW